MYESFLIQEGECFYDVERERWIHSDREKCQHRCISDENITLPSAEIISSLRNTAEIMKRDSGKPNEDLIKIAEEMRVTGENYRNISQYVSFWPKLELPRRIYAEEPMITICMNPDLGKVLICNREYVMHLVVNESGYCFKYI